MNNENGFYIMMLGVIILFFISWNMDRFFPEPEKPPIVIEDNYWQGGEIEIKTDPGRFLIVRNNIIMNADTTLQIFFQDSSEIKFNTWERPMDAGKDHFKVIGSPVGGNVDGDQNEY